MTTRRVFSARRAVVYDRIYKRQEFYCAASFLLSVEDVPPLGHCLPVWSIVKLSFKIRSLINTNSYPSSFRHFKIVGNASGVWSASLWNSTIDPGQTLDVTRLQMLSTVALSFQSRLSTLDTKVIF